MSSSSSRLWTIGGAIAVVGLIAAAAVSYVVFADRGEEKGDPAATSGSTPATTPIPVAKPWKAYDFVAKALPGLVPSTPGGTTYQGATCKPVDSKLRSTNDLDDETPVARILCGVHPPKFGDFSVYIICNRDRAPLPVESAVGNDWPDRRIEHFQRGASSGEVRYGTDPDGYGALVVVFDNASQNYCTFVTGGADGSSGQDVYDNWFRAAPLG